MNQPPTSTGLNLTLQISSNLNGHIQVSTNLLIWTTLTNFVGTNTTLNFRSEPATDQHRVEFNFANFIQSERSHSGFDEPVDLDNADQFRRHQYDAQFPRPGGDQFQL